MIRSWKGSRKPARTATPGSRDEVVGGDATARVDEAGVDDRSADAHAAPRARAVDAERAAAAVAARATARDRAAGTGSRRRTRLGAAVGAATGVLLLGATAAVSSGVLTDAWDVSEGVDVQVPTAVVPAGDYTAVCPGQPRLAGGGVKGSDAEFSAASPSARTTASALVLSDLSASLPGSALLPVSGGEPLAQIRDFTEDVAASTGEPASSSEDGLTNRVAGVARGTTVDAPTLLRAQPLGGLTPVSAATTTYTADDGDLRGLAATACQTPSGDLWLVGASTTLGRSAVLALTNPTETPATVTLELYGPDGAIEASGTRGQLVAPGTTQQFVLAGLAGPQELVAVRVRSEGGRVAAVIQQSVLRGLTPGGVELLTPGAPAGTTQVVPGVVVQREADARRIREQEGYADVTPQLQVVVPGSTDAVLDISVYGQDGEVELPGGGVVSAAAGAVTAVALGSLPEGSYTVAVSSDVSVVASARVTRGIESGEPVDIAGAPSAVRLGSDHALALPEGVDTSLVLGAPGGRAEVTLTPVGTDGVLGAPKVIGIAGGTSVTVPSSSFGGSPAGILIDATGDPVHGALTAVLPGDVAGVSVIGVQPGVAGPQSIPIELGH